MKAHRKYLRLINLMLDARLPGHKLSILHAHLSECKACREEYEHLSAIRGTLRKSIDAIADPVADERRTAGIMAVIKRRATHKGKASHRLALRPALILGSLIIVLILSISIFHHPAPTGPALFSNPQDALLDNLLVDTLNEHETACILEAYNEPATLLAEMKANDRLVMEHSK